MAKKEFSISDHLSPEDVSKLDRSPASMKIIDVPTYSIQVNELNFYDTSNVDELVKSISLNGLLEPIIVMPTEPIPGAVGPAYRIISGHRRFSAWLTLASDDPDKYAAIPAIVRTPVNEIMEELLLIEANRATRVMSSADTAKQAERYIDLLSKLKESGVEIPGRLRDVVAEAMGVSASRLARLTVIRKNLCEEAMSLFEKSTMNESVAYELAQAPVEMQEKILGGSKEPEKIVAWQIKDRIGWLDRISKINCKDGAECSNRERMFAEKCKDSNRYTYLECVQNGKCCKDCPKLYTCSSACRQFADKIKKHKEKEKQQKATEKSEAETKKLNQITENNKQWLRLGYARQQAGITYEEINSTLREERFYYFPGKSTMEKYENCECDDSYYANLLNHLTATQLAVLAKLYGCSADYLLGLSDNLTPSTAPAGWRSLTKDPPVDGQKIIVLDKGGPMMLSDIWIALFREGVFTSPDDAPYDITEDMAARAVGWMPFPEGS